MSETPEQSISLPVETCIGGTICAGYASLRAQVDEIPELLTIAHMQGAEQAKDQIQALRAQIESLDCRLVGRVAELSGSHCPADRPCDRCVSERRIEELSHAYAVQGLALEEEQVRVAELEAELKSIADAKYTAWDDGYNTPQDFVAWVQNRCRSLLKR